MPWREWHPRAVARYAPGAYGREATLAERPRHRKLELSNLRSRIDPVCSMGNKAISAFTSCVRASGRCSFDGVVCATTFRVERRPHTHNFVVHNGNRIGASGSPAHCPWRPVEQELHFAARLNSVRLAELRNNSGTAHTGVDRSVD